MEQKGQAVHHHTISASFVIVDLERVLVGGEAGGIASQLWFDSSGSLNPLEFPLLHATFVVVVSGRLKLLVLHMKLL
ncbi:hypothetical protein V6N13_036663 [Hibiscus sabdariffa]|uniref:Uncharacterized protein n=1 Tax=Hibiscus sabdariffa TaxID=183260 RepID=A0ABR2S5Y2_9ROSI